MIVLIVGKTRMKGGVCVGGYLIVQSSSVRLIPQGRFNNPLNTEYEVGQLWDIEFNRPLDITPPHTEDVLVTASRLVDYIPNVQISEIIKQHRGTFGGLYNGMIRFTANGSGYISQRTGVPNYSTCFWKLERRLSLNRTSGYYYEFFINEYQKIRFPYVGLVEPIEAIEIGAVVRMSLARWWAPRDADIEERCYVQLSGWF